LTEAEAVTAMNRGVTIEQFLERADGQVRYLTAARRRDGFHVLVVHVVKDEGTDDFADIASSRLSMTRSTSEKAEFSFRSTMRWLRWPAPRRSVGMPTHG
jgi:hypothetical protein